MPRIAMLKTGGVLSADTQQAIEALARIPEGTHVMVELRQSRNIGNHRRFFSFLNAVFDMQEFFDNKEALRRWLIMKAGRYKIIQFPNGYTHYEPESIAWEKMDEGAFKELFSDIIDVVLKELHLDKEAIDRVVDFS